MFLRLHGEIYELVYFQHVKPGKGGAFVRTKLKSIETGNVKEVTFRAGESIEPVYYENRAASFLYAQGNTYVFMDKESYEQIEVDEAAVAEIKNFLKEGEDANLVFADRKLLKIEPPRFMVLEVKQTDPGLRGDTVSGGSKPATLETGWVIQVPLFIKTGDKVKVDTRDRKYIERV